MGESSTEFMRLALEQAKLALLIDEVPIGAVIVQDRDAITNKPLESPYVVASAHNVRERDRNPVAHAELLAIIEASKKLNKWRLTGCSLYVTIEPCLMCAGAIILSRVDRVYYGSRDPKGGAVHSLFQTLSDSRLNHRPQITEGVLKEECSQILKEFFAKKRKTL